MHKLNDLFFIHTFAREVAFTVVLLKRRGKNGFLQAYLLSFLLSVWIAGLKFVAGRVVDGYNFPPPGNINCVAVVIRVMAGCMCAQMDERGQIDSGGEVKRKPQMRF